MGMPAPCLLPPSENNNNKALNLWLMTTFIILSNVLNRSKMISKGRKNFLRLTEEEKILIGKKGANRMILGKIKLYYCKTISNSS